ncbi:phage major capsid protein [Cronobacter sakazakii]|nr:phage major capsid protein [Cronobacter sakazakii]MCI0204563.1 phage major capsid protein [Cronobacter sakazakii]MCI0228354.1 phage major capsid protein [Cronobacter sakazakii]MCI0279871.1 phage major capsid protein [Cronobacter sakazakii]MCI0293901.1 phage major capsid protein [Cronobacter sakazakii]
MQQKRATIAAEMRALNEKIGDASWTEEQRSQWDNAKHEYDKLDAAIKREEELRAMDNILAAENEPEHRNNPEGSEDERRAAVFDKFVRHGLGELSTEEKRTLKEFRAQGIDDGEGGGSKGGFTVPKQFRNRVVEAMKAYGGIAGVCQILSTSNGQDIDWTYSDGTADMGVMLGENEEASEGDVTFEPITIGAKKMTSKIIRVSNELLSDFVQSGVLADAAEMFDVIADAFTMVDSGISAAMRLVQGDLSVILMPPSSANDFVRNLQKAWRAGTRLTGDASDLVTMVKTISGVTVDSGLAPRGVWSSDSGTTASRKAQANLVASTMRVVSISEAARAVAQIPSPPGNSALQGGANSVSDIVNISHPALDSQSATTARATPATWDDLTDIRTALNAAIDSEQARTTDDAVFMALTRLRADLNNDISSRLAQVEKTISRIPSESLPAVVLAAQWFDDASRETDILYRNNIAHPGFVPVVPLRVPVR